MNKIIFSNQSVNNKVTSDAQPVEIKIGETYLCSMKEKISGNEAVVKIKGRDLTVKFEGVVPRDDRFMVEVVGIEGDKPRIKAIPPHQVKNQLNIDTKITRDFGGTFSASSTLKEATPPSPSPGFVVPWISVPQDPINAICLILSPVFAICSIFLSTLFINGKYIHNFFSEQ